MIQRKLILFLCVVALFAHVLAMGGMSQKKCRTQEEDIYPCYHDIHCSLGDDTLAELKDCQALITEEDMKMTCTMLKECCNHDVETKDPLDLVEFFCPMDVETKEDTFNKMKKKFVGAMTDACKNPNDPTCERYKEITKCYGDKIEHHNCEVKDCGKNKKK